MSEIDAVALLLYIVLTRHHWITTYQLPLSDTHFSCRFWLKVIKLTMHFFLFYDVTYVAVASARCFPSAQCHLHTLSMESSLWLCIPLIALKFTDTEDFCTWLLSFWFPAGWLPQTFSSFIFSLTCIVAETLGGPVAQVMNSFDACLTWGRAGQLARRMMAG